MRDIQRLPSIDAKLGRMRKPQSFLVIPQDGQIVVQSDKSIGIFDPETGAGRLNTKGCYYMHLVPHLGAQACVFPAEFVKACNDALARVRREEG